MASTTDVSANFSSFHVDIIFSVFSAIFLYEKCSKFTVKFLNPNIIRKEC
jgi:hypothetical protein